MDEGDQIQYRRRTENLHSLSGEHVMRKVISKDGTPIAFDQSGEGPALVLVARAGATRLAQADLSAHLAPHFTVFA
jgi:hypothetical protein